MSLPRVRFTVRGMMVAVAVMAIVLGATSLERRWRRYSILAMEHASTARRLARFSETPGEPDARRTRRISAHFSALSAKYRRLARHPWLPVGPDPPVPE